jgi:hypothetical protein
VRHCSKLVIAGDGIVEVGRGDFLEIKHEAIAELFVVDGIGAGAYQMA